MALVVVLECSQKQGSDAANLARRKEVLRWPKGAGRLGVRIRSPGSRSLPDRSGGRPADLELQAVAASMTGLEGDARDGRGEAEGDGRLWPVVRVAEDGGEARHWGLLVGCSRWPVGEGGHG